MNLKMITLMKNLITIVKLFALVALGFATGCNKTETFDLSDTQLIVENTGGVRQVSVNATGSWTAEVTCGADWLSIQTSEKSIVINVKPTLSQTARMGIVAVKTKGQVKEIAVTQLAATSKDQIIANVTSLNFESVGGVLTIQTTANVTVYASASETWLGVEKASSQGQVTTWNVTAPAYTGSDARTATIAFMGGEAEVVSVPVTQQTAIYLSAAPGVFSATDEGGEFKAVVSANVDWTVSSNQTWATVTPTSGLKNQSAELTITVAANPSETNRTAKITLTGSGLSFAITVNQSGKVTPPVPETLLAAWRCDDAEYVDSHSPDWSTNGANVYSHGSGKGIALPESGAPTGATMKWVRTTDSSYGLTYITAGEGHFAVKAVGALDGYLFSIPGQTLEANKVIKIDVAVAGTGTCPKNWVAKFRTSESADWTVGDSNTAHNTNSGAVAFMTFAKEKDYSIKSRFQATYVLPAAVSNATVQIFVCAADAETINGGTSSSATSRLIELFDADGNEEYPGPRITLR